MELRLVNETRTIVLAQAGMQANQFACVIDHTGNITNFTENHTGKSFFFPQDSRLKNYVLVCKSSIDFIEVFIPYNELQFFDWPGIVVHSPAGLMDIAHGLVILVHRNIQVTTITIDYIQLCQGFEC